MDYVSSEYHMYRANKQLKTNGFRHFQLVLSLHGTIKVNSFLIFQNKFLQFFMYSFSVSNTTQHNSCFTYEVSFHHNQDVDFCNFLCIRFLSVTQLSTTAVLRMKSVFITIKM